MSGLRLATVLAGICVGVIVMPTHAAGTEAQTAVSPATMAPIAIGLAAIALAILVMHRARLRLRKAEAKIAAALRENERRYRAIVEDQSELICRWRPDGLHTYANPAYCRSFGLSSEEMLKTKVLDLIPKEDHAQATRHWASLTPTRPAGTHQHRVVADGGQIRLQEWTDRAIFDADGGVVEYQSVGRDITDRQEAEDRLRESEARFRMLGESAPIGIFRTSVDGTTNFINAHLLQLSGLTLEESLGQGWMKVIHPEDRAGVYADIAENRAERKSFQREFRIVTTRNEVRWIRVRTVWVERADGDPAEQIGTVEDITDQKRAIENARIQRDLAAELGNAVHLGEAMDLVLAALFRISGCDAGAVHLVDGDSGDVQMLHSKGFSQAYLSEFFHLPASSSIARAIANGNVLCGRAGEDLLTPEVRERENLRWAALVPIMFKSKNIGAIVIASHEVSSVPECELAVLESVSAQIGGAIGRLRAIGELRAERDHSTRIIRGTPAIVCGITPDGTTLFVNPACERITGYAKDDIVGKHWWDTFYPGEEHTQVRSLLERIKQGDVRDYEMRLTCRNGEKRVISWNSITRLEDNGDLAEIIGFGNDVTERRRAEDELRKFKTIADNTPHGQAIVALDGALLYVNHAWAKMHGYTPEELAGRHLNIFHSEDQMTHVNKLNDTLVREGSYASQEVWHIRKDGTAFPTLMDATVIKDETGKPLYLSGMASDITESKRSEEAVRRACEKMRLAAVAAGFGVWELDPTTNQLEWDEGMFRLYGVGPGDFSGTFADWQKGLHADDADRANTEVALALEGEREFDTEFRILRPDGEVRHIKACATVTRDTSGRPLRMTGINYDITQRKQHEASLQLQALVLDSINDAVYLTDADNRIIYWNTAAADVFGYAAEEVIGRTPTFIYHPYEIETLDDCIRTGLLEDGFWADEMRYRTNNGNEIICETFSAPVHNERNEWISTVTVHRDVTARKKAEEDRAQLRDQLYHGQKLKAVGTLAAGIAHDFNNLLSAIFGHTHLAKSLLNADHPALRSLEMVSQTAQQARGVISALLTFTRKSVTLKQRMNVVQSVADAVRLLRRLLPGSIEIVQNLPDTPLWVNGDDAQLKQIWTNLAVNARDAMTSGGTLRVEVSEVDDHAALERAVPAVDATDRAFVHVCISDTGCGMSEEVLNRVFEPFFTTKPRSDGTGLGMSVVLGIAEDHGGAVQIDSAEDKGTVVNVFLPLCSLPGQAALPQDRPEPPKHTGTVILCEDDSQIRSILTSSLRNSAFDVHGAADLESALGLYTRHLADVGALIVNFDQPKLDRADVLSRVRQTASNVPIVMITADKAWQPLSGLENHERILRMPYQVEDLLCTLNDVLGNTC